MFREDQSLGRFEAVEDGQVVGWVEYETVPGGIDIKRTIVPEQCAGRGIAGALVGHVLGDSRARGRSVIPSCSFVQAYLVTHPEYGDLVARSAAM
jgi:predicted GNAT family acetyltransferase